MIVNAFTEFGIAAVAGELPCFINLTREFCVGELALPFGPDRAVLEILETVEVDDEVIAGVTRLAEAGFRIALDDFTWGLGHERLLDVASYVKVDFLALGVADIEDVIAACRRRRRVSFVAEKLETDADVALADRLGCELRQGYRLSRPQVLTVATLNPSRVRRLELLAALNSAEADVEKVLSIIANDPALSMRILRGRGHRDGPDRRWRSAGFVARRRTRLRTRRIDRRADHRPRPRLLRGVAVVDAHGPVHADLTPGELGRAGREIDGLPVSEPAVAGRVVTHRRPVRTLGIRPAPSPGGRT